MSSRQAITFYDFNFCIDEFYANNEIWFGFWLFSFVFQLLYLSAFFITFCSQMVQGKIYFALQTGIFLFQFDCPFLLIVCKYSLMIFFVFFSPQKTVQTSLSLLNRVVRLTVSNDLIWLKGKFTIIFSHACIKCANASANRKKKWLMLCMKYENSM